MVATPRILALLLIVALSLASCSKATGPETEEQDVVRIVSTKLLDQGTESPRVTVASSDDGHSANQEPSAAEGRSAPQVKEMVTGQTPGAQPVPDLGNSHGSGTSAKVSPIRSSGPVQLQAAIGMAKVIAEAKRAEALARAKREQSGKSQYVFDDGLMKLNMANASAAHDPLVKLLNVGGTTALNTVLAASKAFSVKGSARNKDATTEAFVLAVENLDASKLKKARELSNSGRLDAFVVLVGATGRFVTGPGKVNTDAYNAALDNIDAEKMKQMKGIMPGSSSKMAFVCLLSSSGLYTEGDGQFGIARYNSVLAAMEPGHVKKVMEAMESQSKPDAFMLLMLASSTTTTAQ